MPHDTLHVVLVSGQSEAVTFHEWTGTESYQRTLDRLVASGTIPLGVLVFRRVEDRLEGSRGL